MANITYRLVTELARPGEHFDLPEGVQPVVEPSQQRGFVRITYPKPVTSVPIEDGSPVYFE